MRQKNMMAWACGRAGVRLCYLFLSKVFALSHRAHQYLEVKVVFSGNNFL
jgi:hypothetical protein